MTPDDPAGDAVAHILAAVEEIAKTLVAGDPKRALEQATQWAKTIGTDRAYLLALAQRQARDGKQAARSLVADEAGEDLLEIGRLMQKWGWEQVERSCGFTVVTRPEQARTIENEEPSDG